MGKKVLILMGSPRKNGNSDILSDEFARGAKDAGHELTKVIVKEKQINECLGCCACLKNGGKCVQKDDMQNIYEQMNEADVIVLTSPVYFSTWSATMKRLLDRTIAVAHVLKHKTFYLISAAMATDESYMTTMLDNYHRYANTYRSGGSKEGGYVFGYGTDKPGDVVGTPAMSQAYEMGKDIL